MKQFSQGTVAPFLSELIHETRQHTEAGMVPAHESRLLDRLNAAISADEILTDYVREQVATVLGLDLGQQIDQYKPLNELGVDSLMAVELRNRLGAGLELQQRLPATLIFKYPTIEAVVKYLSQDVLALNTSTTHGARVTASHDSDSDIAEIASLSDDELHRLLEEELRSLDSETSDLEEE